MLVLAFAFAGHYMGQNAVAHNAEPGDVAREPSRPRRPTSSPRARCFPRPPASRSSNLTVQLASEQVVADRRQGRLRRAARPWPTSPKPSVIVPASVDLKAEDDEPTSSVGAGARRPRKVEKAIKLKRSASAKPKDKDTQKAIAQRRVQLAEENCLARAVYFEARSESELGQLAVAKVILNRVKDPEYPKTICGVVYQGSGRRNSCQFSFACDGLPDDVKSAAAWANAKRIAQKAIAGDAKVAAVGTATNYHADYVKPEMGQEHEAAHQDRPSHLLRRFVTRLHG